MHAWACPSKAQQPCPLLQRSCAMHDGSACSSPCSQNTLGTHYVCKIYPMLARCTGAPSLRAMCRTILSHLGVNQLSLYGSSIGSPMKRLSMLETR